MTILFADDDPILLDSLRACAEREGYSVLLARDGVEAWQLWEERRPQLLCVDVMMPRMDGYELCRRVRAVDATVPLLFLSAKNEEIDVVVGLQLGADDFVRKPFGRHELVARLRAVFRRQEAASRRPPRSFLMHDLTVWPHELRAERGDACIDLSPREAAILSLLHERAGEALSRDCFFNRCWGQSYFPDSRTLDQHIARLRRRIERDPLNPVIIETVRGVGYRYRPLREVGSHPA